MNTVGEQRDERERQIKNTEHVCDVITQSGAPSTFWFFTIVSGRQKSAWRRLNCATAEERRSGKDRRRCAHESACRNNRRALERDSQVRVGPHRITPTRANGYGVLRVALKLSSRDFFQRCAPALSEMETTERLNGGEHPDVTQIYVCLYFCCVHM